MRTRITDETITKLKAGQSIADQEVKGFIARRLPSGLMTFGYRYRNAAGKQVWATLEGLNLTAAQARKAAKVKAGQVAAGNDPVAQAKVAAATADGLLFGNVAQRFLELHARKNCRPNTIEQYELIFRRFLVPAFADTPIDAIKRSDVFAMLDTVKGDAMADRTLAAIRKMFNWHAVRSDDFRSPIVAGMSRSTDERRARTRVLDEQEIRDVWRVLEEPSTHPHASQRYCDHMRLILLTGQRPGEVAGMRPDEIEEYRGTPVWRIPAERYKLNKEHWVPLTPAALAIIEPGLKGEYVFSFSGRAKQTPIGNGRTMNRLRARVNELRKQEGRKPMPNWTRHDLRRTARSLMSIGGKIERDHAERVLGHAIHGVGGTYDRHAYLEEKRKALEILAATIAKVIKGPPAGKVVRFKPKAA
jgi:integrase